MVYSITSPLGVSPSSDNGYTGYTRCDNLSLFVRKLRHLVTEQEWEGQSVYVVLDNIGGVVMEDTLIHSLVKLAELV